MINGSVFFARYYTTLHYHYTHICIKRRKGAAA